MTNTPDRPDFRLQSARPVVPDVRVPGISQLPGVASALGLGGLLNGPFERLLDRSLRPRYFKHMTFDGPAGDPGWFGPGSAVWHVHAHFPTLLLGLYAAAHMESLHPSIAWMSYDHSRAIARDGDGRPLPDVPLDPAGVATRLAHSLVFFTATAYGPTDTAERAARAVRAMHHTVKGVRPDGVAYDADDPRWLRWNYATVVWGIAAAHQRYHPDALRGDEIDRYYREFVRVGDALGGTDLPASERDVLDYLASHLPELAVTPITSAREWPNARWRTPVKQQPLDYLLWWAASDLQPRWAQDLYSFAPMGRIGTHARRHAVYVLLNAIQTLGGPVREYRQSVARAHETARSSG